MALTPKQRRYLFASGKFKSGPSVNKKNYAWGRMVTIEKGSDYSIPLHPKQQNMMKALKDGESTYFKDESKQGWTVARKGNSYHFKSGSDELWISKDEVD